jgi:hypothetical protein
MYGLFLWEVVGDLKLLKTLRVDRKLPKGRLEFIVETDHDPFLRMT